MPSQIPTDLHTRSYLFRNVRTRPFKPSIYRVNIWCYFNPTPINRVNNAISNTYSTSQIKSAKNVFAIFSSNWWKNCIFLDIFEKLVKSSVSFGKEHANWSDISGVMIGWSWKIKFEKSIIFFGYTKFEFSKLDFLTSSYHNSINTGPIDMIFTKKCNYFSWATRWNHSFLSQSQ